MNDRSEPPPIPNLATQEPIQKKFSRREFLEIAALTVAGIVSGCTPREPQVRPTTVITPTAVPSPYPTVDATAVAPPVETPPGLQRIEGVVEGDYSDFIRNHNLQPKIFYENENKMQRMQGAMDYLRKLREALKNANIQGTKFSTYGINSTDNYPIEIDDNYTIYDYLNNFLNDYDDRLILIEDGKNPGAVLSTITKDFEFVNGKWQIKQSVIYVNDYLNYDKGFYLQESPTIYYKGRTDLELAIAAVHEYAHIRQIQAYLTGVNNGTISITEPNYAPNKIAAVKQAVIDRHFTTVKPEERDEVIEILNKVPFSELQADAVALTIFDFMNELNENRNNGHFPGTRRRDPVYQYNIDATKKRNPRNNVVDSYKSFRENLKATRDALNPRYAIDWSWLKYPGTP